MHKNELCGEVPTSFNATNLPALTELRLDNNHLSTSDVNVIDFLNTLESDWENSQTESDLCPIAESIEEPVVEPVVPVEKPVEPIVEPVKPVVEPPVQTGTDCSDDQTASDSCSTQVFGYTSPVFTASGPYSISGPYSTAKNANHDIIVGNVDANNGVAGAVADVDIIYIIIDGNINNVFAINNDTGVITVNDNTQLDREKIPNYTLQVEANNGHKKATIAVDIAVKKMSFEEASSSLGNRLISGWIGVTNYANHVNQCNASGTLSCNASGKTISDLKLSEVKKGGSLTGVVIDSTLTNNGLLSNITVAPEGIVTGGKITSYTTNEGQMNDFEFVGASITGANEKGEFVGTLGGTIHNNSKIGGSFENIHLAPETHIIGGILEKTIIGDTEKPAILENLHIKPKSNVSNVILQEDVTYGEDTSFNNVEFKAKQVQQVTLSGEIKGNSTTLENVTIKSPSTLSNVIIGNKVKFEDDDITFGENVTFSVHNEYMESHNITPLPVLGNATNSLTSITGGVLVDNEFKAKATFESGTDVKIAANLLVDPRHIGKSATIWVTVNYTDRNGLERSYMLNNEGQLTLWNGDFANILPFQKQTNLASVQHLDIWDTAIIADGKLEVLTGYQLTDGTVVYSPDNFIEFEATE